MYLIICFISDSLAALCQQAIWNCTITIIKNDELDIATLQGYLRYFDAVVVGPGPGSPDNPKDIGLVRDLWKMQEQDILPIFGVCLGLQSLAIEHKASLHRLHQVKHGQISHIKHVATDIFEDMGMITAVRYHSLHVKLQQNGDVNELAWTDDEENGRVVMAVKHCCRPFWAVQYHPESVCTDQGGLQVIRNFWRLSKQWCMRVRRRTIPWSSDFGHKFGCLWPDTSSISTFSGTHATHRVSSATVQRRDLSVVDICEAFGASYESTRFVLLESASAGRFSIIGCLSPSSPHIQFRVGDSFVSIQSNGRTVCESLGPMDIWSWLAEYMKNKDAINGDSTIPFWGGLIGYLSYEIGVHSLHVPSEQRAHKSGHSDVNLIFVERSIVVDNESGLIHVQSIVAEDYSWLDKTVAHITNLDIGPSIQSFQPQGKPDITYPNKSIYISRIHQAKEHLAAGDSYELCLTAQTRISFPFSRPTNDNSTSWERYKWLRKSNPAPHSAYLRLHPSTLLSSSPERFLSYSRPPGTVCQLRPIKGTVRKAPHITRSIAERALIGSPKEVAENLMIVDLIRHDLHGVVGQDVKVKQFCSVEEYETVWQLVSVIEGKLNGHPDPGVEDQLGWEVLRRSLPPGIYCCSFLILTDIYPALSGSMTGAPKKRSVEILRSLEDQERSIYSGVFGYWCVSGSGDWSVTIRSCFKFEPEVTQAQPNSEVDKTEEWVIGAGGAITALSDPEAEWEEMQTKLNSVLRAFVISL